MISHGTHGRGREGGREEQWVGAAAGEEGRGCHKGSNTGGARSMVVGSLCSCARSCKLFLREVDENRKEKRDKRKGRERGKDKEEMKKKFKPETFRGEK
jgi:hypothetical protein